MNRYTQQFFSLIEIIYQKVIQRIFDRLAPQGSQKPPQPDSPQREAYSFTEIARRATEEKESEQIEIASIAKTNRNNDRHCNKRRRSKRAKWAEDKSKQDSAYVEAKAICEVDDQGEALLKAVKQLISEHDRLNKTNEDIL